MTRRSQEGRDRYASQRAFALLQPLYRLLRLQLNFLRPFRKLLSGRRAGRKRYDAARTPYQRLLAAAVLSEPQRQALAAQFLAVNPATLARDIGDTLAQLWQLGASRRPRPVAHRG